MGTPGSGRRKAVKRPAGFALPPWGNTEESIRARLQAVSDAFYSKQLDSREYDLEQKHAQRHLAGVGQEKDRGKLNTLREYLERAEAVALAGVKRAVADRKHLHQVHEEPSPDVDFGDPPVPN